MNPLPREHPRGDASAGLERGAALRPGLTSLLRLGSAATVIEGLLAEDHDGAPYIRVRLRDPFGQCSLSGARGFVYTA